MSNFIQENAHLRRLLAEHNVLIPPVEPPMRSVVKPMEASSLDERQELARKRIALFRVLFRGRDDVYACRGERAAGRSGYSAAAQKDWKAINRSRPQDRQKVDQKTRKYFPLTDSVIENHLLGKETTGVATTSWPAYTNRALMSEFQSIWVSLERKADSPNC